ncbi:glutamate receptor 2-like [Ruditapes philippinarum]|uniref:glutamate receptor 2-like n=1 Tax=Ruditapes philippinarum TaxID=129788 RepID=UPI00295AF716|nr:glutamate receptor 2-like [Ruditapes philippinarum]
METREDCLLLILFAFGYLSSVNSQTPLRVTSVHEEPFLIKDADGGFSGMIPDILDSLKLNYSISLSPDGSYGRQLNGTWLGMIGELVNGNADIAGFLTVTAPRSEAVDFSYPVVPIGLSILMKKPRGGEVSLDYDLARLFYPFELSVWLMAFVAMFVTGTVLYIMMHFNPYEWRRMARDHEATAREGESFTCLNSFFFVFSTLMWQGYVRAPRSIGARVLVAAWWCFTILFIVSYTANLTNLLRIGPDYFASQEFSKIKSFEDLSKNADMRVGFLNSGSTYRFFRESKSPFCQELFQRAINDQDNENFNSIHRLKMHVRNNKESNFAAIMERPAARFIANRKPCDLYAVHVEDLTYKHYAFALQKNSSIASDLNTGLIKLTETGELHEIEKKWFDERGGCTGISQLDRKESVRFYKLDLSTFSSAMLIVVAGIIIGGIICLIEICIFKWAESRDSSEETEHITADEETIKAAEGKGAATPV